MPWIYLSPHLDDAALSCGGWIWEQAQSAQAPLIWTICSADPPEAPLSDFAEALHRRWQSGRQATALRRAEDIHSCQIMGAGWRHFSLPDCIYRQGQTPGEYLYDSEAAIFGDLHPEEAELVERLGQDLRQAIREAELSSPGEPVRVVVPLSLGGHVDHRLTRVAAEQTGDALWYYADYPYILSQREHLADLLPAGWQPVQCAVSAAGLAAWQQAVAAHASQISTFWLDLEHMQSAIRDYWQNRRDSCCGNRLEQLDRPR